MGENSKMNPFVEISGLWFEWKEMVKSAQRQPDNPYFQVAAAVLQTKLVCKSALYWAKVRPL